jgi:macrolide transport system ATP-binding/permease protein
MTFFRKLGWLLRRRSKEEDLRDEIAFHLEEEADERTAAGSPNEEARLAARRDLGNVTLVQENTRAAWSWIWLEQLFQDLRYAVRTMLQNKAFTMLAALSLALGIGANVAIFSFMDTLLLRSLPVADSESLAVINWHAKGEHSSRDFVMHGMSGSTWDDPKLGETAGIFPYPAFEMLQKRQTVFSTMFAFIHWTYQKLNFAAKGRADLVTAEYVSGDYFRGLEILPAAGRLLDPSDDKIGGPAVVVISNALGERRFGGASEAVGQSVLINNVPFVIAGVAPPEFFGVSPGIKPDIYIPLHANLLIDAANPFGTRADSYLEQNTYWIEMMGRLRPGVTFQQAQAQLAPLFAQWVATTAHTDKERASLPELILAEGASGLSDLRRKYSQPLFILMAMVGLILAIACANVANLLLARASARRREIALRLSAGAGRFRVVRQLLTESVLLALIGGAAGVVFAIWGVRVLTVLLSKGNVDLQLHAELNWHVLGVAVALSILTGVIFGLAPALQSTRLDLISAIKETPNGESRGQRRMPRIGLSHALIVVQIAFSLIMLVGAGLFVRTLTNLHSIDLGFNRENVLLFELDARKAGLKEAEIAPFYASLRERFANVPGVRAASLSESPIVEAGHGTTINVPGKQPDRATRFLTVGPEFFSTMQIPILAGRENDKRDHAGTPAVALINEVFAKRNFGDENPLGRHLSVARGVYARDVVIVGLSKNVPYGGLKHKTPPVVYLPFDQGYPPPREMTYALRTSGDPLAFAGTVREIVRQADSRVPVMSLQTQTAEIDSTISQEIMFAQLCSAFAILALVIACVGLYGTLSYNVARRTGEIGIRMALGARRGRVVWMVMREILVIATVALLISIPVALSASKFVESFLYGMKPNDPRALTGAIAVLLIASIIAAYVPSRRASRIDPMVALRHE